MSLFLALSMLLACDGGGSDPADDTDDTDAADTDVAPTEGPPALVGAPPQLAPHTIVAYGDGWLLGGESEGDVAVVKLKVDGAVDTAWGEAGAVVRDLGGPDGGFVPTDLDAAFALAVDGDGVWVGGVGWGAVTSAQGRFAVLRLGADGALDAGFGDGGVVVTDWSVEAAVQTVEPDGDGVVAWGNIQNPLSRDVAAVRYDAAGAVDATFTDGDGGAGFVAPADGDEAAAVVLPSGDHRLVGGGPFALRRIGPDGALDLSYGEGGRLSLADGRLDLAAPLAGGGAVLAGVETVEADGEEVGAARLVRVDDDGAPVESFGVRDVVVDLAIVDFGEEEVPTSVIRVRGLAEADDGRLVLYVQLLGLVNQVPAVLVLTADGALDPSFGEGGVLLLEGSLPLFAGAFSSRDGLLVVDGDEAILADQWLYDAPGGGIEARTVVVRVPL